MHEFQIDKTILRDQKDWVVGAVASYRQTNRSQLAQGSITLARDTS